MDLLEIDIFKTIRIYNIHEVSKNLKLQKIIEYKCYACVICERRLV